MSANTALALKDEEALPGHEAVPNPETTTESAIEGAINSGNEAKIFSIFGEDAAAAAAAAGRLAETPPEVAATARKVVDQIALVTKDTTGKIEIAKKRAIGKVAEVIQITRKEAPAVAEAAPEIAPVEVVAVAPVEVIQPSPMIRVGEAPNADPELIHEAEELKAHEQEQIEAELAALNDFSKDHPLAIDTSDPNIIKVVVDNKIAGLNKVERFYADTIVAGHKAANTSLRHAEALLAAYALPESDPQRAELMAKSETLLEQAQVDEVAAQFLKGQYMKLPEITAMLNGGGEGTGGSIEGSNFHAHDSPFKGPPDKPAKHAGVVVPDGGVGSNGIADVAVKATDIGGAKVEKKPSFIDKWVGGMFSKLTFGWYKSGGGGSRE